MRKRTTGILVGGVAVLGLFAAIAFAADSIFDNPPPTRRASTQPRSPAPPAASRPAKSATSQPVARHDPEPAAAPSIVVAYARYGAGDRWADVTEPCKRLVRDRGLKLPRNLHRTLGADPIPGYMKYLELSLVINGAEVWLTVADNLELDPLNLSTEPPPDPK